MKMKGGKVFQKRLRGCRTIHKQNQSHQNERKEHKMYKYIRHIALALTMMVAVPSALAATALNNYKIHTPSEIFEIMEQSDITYAILTADKIERTNLTAVPIPLPFIDPFIRIKYTEDGKASLITHDPNR